MVDAISHITVGTADLAPVRALWIDRFGLEVVAERAGLDESVARLWNIPADQVRRQVLLGTPGAQTGRLHFVQFAEPDPPVRAGAAPTDLGPKNLDANCTDLPGRHAEYRLSRPRQVFWAGVILAYALGWHLHHYRQPIWLGPGIVHLTHLVSGGAHD